MFLEPIDGMVYPENPRQGFFRGPLFPHADLKFQFQFANGWPSENSIHGFPAIAGESSARTGQGSAKQGTATFIGFSGASYQVTACSTSARFNACGSAMQASLTSFKRLTDPAALAVQPMRLSVATAPRAMTLARFHSQFPSSLSLDEVALTNGTGPTDPLRSGQTVKRVPGSPPA